MSYGLTYEPTVTEDVTVAIEINSNTQCWLMVLCFSARYLINPFSVATCVGRSTTLLSSLSIILSLLCALKGYLCIGANMQGD